tara:strand:- start:484 stop:690 length:207 start_codon:yes stop_codon:yes gene_type:complete
VALRSSVPIPVASTEYDAMNEAITRRTIEQALQDIHADIGELRRMQESIVSKATRRHQFLLMGVKHGG